jgi:hypothetical protein
MLGVMMMEILAVGFEFFRWVCSLVLLLVVINGAEAMGKKFANRIGGEQTQKKSELLWSVVPFLLASIGIFLWVSRWNPF